jgi:nucleoid DNA-binding protein
VKTIYEPIEKLLAQHEYVIVPNLGGFVVQKQSATITDDCIKAPFSTLAFNPLMQHPDGLLAIEIARTQSISYRLAMEIIEKEVTKVKVKLEQTGAHQFGNLGLLSQNKLGQLQFIPTEKADFLPNNIGLSDIYLTARSGNFNENNKTIKFTLPSAKAIKYAAAAVLLLGLLLISPQVNDVRLANQANLSSLLYSTPNYKTTKIEKKQDLVKEVAKDSLVENPKTPVKTEMFHVVVASWESTETANKYCQELTAAAYTQAHVVSPVKKNHVAIQSFSEKKDAVAFMKELKKTNHKFESAWVLCESSKN